MVEILKIIDLLGIAGLVIGGVYFLFEKEYVKGVLSFLPIPLMVLALGITVIPANTVGVKYSALSGTSKETLEEGVHLMTPFVNKVYMFDLTVQERTDEGISIQTKDAQWLKATVNVKYQVNKKDAFKVYKGYKTLEALSNNIVGNFTQEALNTVCTKYNVIDVLGEKRNAFVEETRLELEKKFKEEGVTLKAITIKDIDAGEAIEKAIADEAVAKKQVETAKQNKEKAKMDAETKIIEAQGQADANKVLTQSITDELIRMKEAEARMKHGWIEATGVSSIIK